MMTTAAGTGLIEMRISKVVAAGGAGDGPFECIVLDEPHGDRHLVIQVGWSDAFSLAATLGGVTFGRPMTHQFAAALVAGLGGRGPAAGVGHPRQAVRFVATRPWHPRARPALR